MTLRTIREDIVREHMESENRHEFDVTMGTFRHPRYEIIPTGEVHQSVQSTIDSTRGGGSSLDAGVADRLSPSLGDLSDVRVHTDQTAHDLNHAVSARAFATGTDVYFAQNQYKPNTSDGDKLIAHELAHVVQQRGAPTSGPLTVSNPGDSMEREADDVAARVDDGAALPREVVELGHPDAVEWLAGAVGLDELRAHHEPAAADLADHG